MARRIWTTTLVLLVVGVLSALGAGPASAQTGTYLRLAHLSPDTPTVDVLVTSFGGETTRLDGVSYGDVSTYAQIDPGSYTLQMLPAGAADGTPPVVTGTLEARAGGAYTAAGLGPRAELAVRVLEDDLTPAGPDSARVRVVQGAEAAGPLGVRWAGAPAFDAVAFGTATEYVTVPAGPGSFELVPGSGEPVRIDRRLDAGAVYSVIVVQRDGMLDAQVTPDAAGPGAVPVGGVDTGLGGAADPPFPGMALVGGALVLLGMGAAARARVRR
jgi:hypothetical protein